MLRLWPKYFGEDYAVISNLGCFVNRPVDEIAELTNRSIDETSQHPEFCYAKNFDKKLKVTNFGAAKSTPNTFYRIGARF